MIFKIFIPSNSKKSIFHKLQVHFPFTFIIHKEEEEEERIEFRRDEVQVIDIVIALMNGDAIETWSSTRKWRRRSRRSEVLQSWRRTKKLEDWWRVQTFSDAISQIQWSLHIVILHVDSKSTNTSQEIFNDLKWNSENNQWMSHIRWHDTWNIRNKKQWGEQLIINTFERPSRTA